MDFPVEYQISYRLFLTGLLLVVGIAIFYIQEPDKIGDPIKLQAANTFIAFLNAGVYLTSLACEKQLWQALSSGDALATFKQGGKLT